MRFAQKNGWFRTSWNITSHLCFNLIFSTSRFTDTPAEVKRNRTWETVKWHKFIMTDYQAPGLLMVFWCLVATQWWINQNKSCTLIIYNNKRVFWKQSQAVW